MKEFFIRKLSENEIQTAKDTYGKGYTNGHQCEHALQKHFNNEYTFVKDNRKFTEYSDIDSENASAKSANCTLFVSGKAINENTPLKDAVSYYIQNDYSHKYFIVLDTNKWCKKSDNEYVVIELNKYEMTNLLNEMACTDRDSRLKNGKNCLRLKRKDDVLYKWYLMNR